ncbi:MAG: hypothetical protein KGL39_20530 [Patescibacteria group bacterium]|nr:hypothetical protein [Patescibacteria group bacterium]
MVLQPALWRVEDSWGVLVIRDANGDLVMAVPSRELAEQIVLWRNAEDVQLRLGWTARQSDTNGPKQEWCTEDTWGRVAAWIPVDDTDPSMVLRPICADTPARALVEADRWMKERENRS